MAGRKVILQHDVSGTRERGWRKGILQHDVSGTRGRAWLGERAFYNMM